MILLPLLLQTIAPAEIDCADPQTQSAMNICAAQDYAAADADLNAQWAVTAAKTRERDASTGSEPDDRPGHFATLLEAQRAWLRFRDAHCASEGFYARGGSLEPLLVSKCKAELTRARTRQLRDLAQWP